MWIIADVTFDNDEDAREAQRLVEENKISGVSVDLADPVIEIEILEVDEEGFPTDWLETIVSAEIIGATQVVMPAFADAHIEYVDGRFLAFLAPEGPRTSDRRVISPGALVWRENAPLMFNDTSDGHNGATFVGNLNNFRRSALVADADFTPPGLRGLTKPQIKDGRLKGHGAGWGTCHTGFKNACVTAPTSTYSQVADGVKIYRHPNGDIHAPLHLDAEEAKQWYETHCETFAIAGVGEDDYGIWVNSTVEAEEGELFLSGDWREVDDGLELISFLIVENPGFPTALVAGSQKSLTAAGIVTHTDELQDRVTRLEETIETMRFEAQVREMMEAFE